MKKEVINEVEAVYR